MPIRRLQTVDDVVEAIGRERLYALTGKRTNNVTNWLTSGHFPRELFYLMDRELQRIGCSAPPRLWRQVERTLKRAS